MHSARPVLALLVVTATAGCLGVANMQDLKVQLGAAEVPDPPTAAFDASATSVLPDETVNFTAAPSTDPAGDGLSYDWSFGDGATAQGRTASHAWTTPGRYDVTLTVTDARDRADETTTLVDVGIPNRAPEAALTVTDPSGDPITSAPVDATVLLSSEASTDPDGDPLAYDWTLGDGATASGTDVSHAYDTPGLYPITVTVTDSEGAADEASTTLAVTLDRTWEETISAPNTSRAHAFPVADAPRVVANLSFPAGPLAGNDLDLAVRNPDGGAVGTSNTTTDVGASGTQYEEVVLDPETVADEEPGAWTAEVTRSSGTDVDYTLRVIETFPDAE